MKTKTLATALTVVLGLTAFVACAMLIQSRNTARVASEPRAAVAAPGESEFGRVDVKAMAANLTFLGGKPALAGRPVLLEFWATWCPPCRASIAHLNQLNAKYHGRGLEIVGVSDEDKSTVERFRARTPMNYAVALDAGQTLASEFQVRGIPAAWLLDREGRIVWSGHPMQLDEQTIERVLPADPSRAEQPPRAPARA